MWLICRTALGRGKGKILLRGIKGAEWVFCPAIKSTKRDRVSIDRCQGCKYFVRFQQTYVPETRTAGQRFSFRKTTSKGTCHIAKRPIRSKTTHPHATPSLYIPNLIEEKKPLIDIFEEIGHIVILAELPSVDENDVGLKAEENTLTISADNATRKYKKKVQLPTAVKKDTIKSIYKNNILQVTLEKLCTTKNG